MAAEFNASNASQGPALLRYKALIIGQKTTAGSGVADTVVRVTSADAAIAIAGRGSMLHRQAIAWFASNQSTEVWLGILDDDGGAVVSESAWTIAGPATADGTLAVYVGGKRFAVAVTDADTATVIGDAVAAAVNADLDLPVTAVNAIGVVTFTHRNLGEEGNSYDLRINYRDSDESPAGVTGVPPAFTSGAGNPALTNLIAALGDVWYNIVAHPYTDATSLTAIEAELALRSGPLKMIDGVAITSATGTIATLAALGNTRNSKHSSIHAQPGKLPLTWPVEFGAEVAAIVAFYGQIDPARPFQTLSMAHAIQPAEVDLFTLEERNSLLFDGIGTTKTAAGGAIQIERAITTSQTNDAGADDPAYLDITTLLTLMYLRYSWRTRMLTRYPRHKLASDGTRFGAGQSVMTPKLGTAEALGWFRQMEQLGLVEGFDQFKADLVVERNIGDQNRLDVLLPPDLINQLIVTATQIAFRL